MHQLLTRNDVSERGAGSFRVPNLGQIRSTILAIVVDSRAVVMILVYSDEYMESSRVLHARVKQTQAANGHITTWAIHP